SSSYEQVLTFAAWGGAEAKTEMVSPARIRSGVDRQLTPLSGESVMSVASYGIALSPMKPRRVRRFLAWLAQSIDSLVASRSRNVVLDRDLRQARQDMERVARLLDAGSACYRGA